MDFYRIQVNVGIGLLNGTLQLLSMQPNHLPGVSTEDGQAIANTRVPQLPYMEQQSEYFRGERGEVLQAATLLGAGVIMGRGRSAAARLELAACD